jgi:tryptophan synthase beta chain
VTDEESLEGVKLLCLTEGIIPALETAHAIAHLHKVVAELPEGALIILCLSGRGDKDVFSIAKGIGREL